jgi:hypothetical protein
VFAALIKPSNGRGKASISAWVSDCGRPAAPWSIAALGVPLPIVATLLAQTVAVVLWVGKQSDKLDTVIEQQKEIRTEIYKQGDATRDLALRDDRIAELGRRIELLERVIDGRRR